MSSFKNSSGCGISFNRPIIIKIEYLILRKNLKQILSLVFYCQLKKIKTVNLKTRKIDFGSAINCVEQM